VFLGGLLGERDRSQPDHVLQHLRRIHRRLYRQRIENRIRPGNARAAAMERMAGHTPAADRCRRRRSTVLAALVFASAGLIAVVGGDPRPIGEADGALPVGVTVFSERTPAVTNLDPDLRAALRRASADAERHGIQLVINSGWRSPTYQERLLDDAVSKFKSREKAARWVATADSSLHVSGDAVDVGPSSAAAWLAKRGATYGLCRIYRNEPWHYELRRDAMKRGCPSMYLSPAHDPRMQP
jgi:hypothetical protein